MIDWLPILLTLKLALITTAVLLFFGLPVAYWLSKGQSFGKIIIEALLTLPLVLPPSVLGFYLLIAFSPQRGFGAWLLKYFDLQLIFSFPGLVFASVIYSLPFMLSPIKSALQQLPKSLADASFTMGKSETETFFKVLLPNISASLLTASVMTFAHTLGEFGVVLMIGGNIPGITRVASIAIYNAVENMDYQSANIYSMVLVGFSFFLVMAVFIINKYAGKNVAT